MRLYNKIMKRNESKFAATSLLVFAISIVAQCENASSSKVPGFSFVTLNKTNLVISEIGLDAIVVAIDADDKLIELRLETNEDMDVCSLNPDDDDVVCVGTNVVRNN